MLSLTAPYHPQRYIDAIHECEEAGMEVIIIDSITHEWSGVGGCLEIQQMEVDKQRVKNTYTAWKVVTPIHQKFIDAILQSKCHIITTVRSKTDYMQVDDNGRKSIQKVGMAQVTRDGFEYELTVSLDLDENHRAVVSKDRTNLFEGQPAFIPTIETGAILRQWCETGVNEKQELLDSLKDCVTRQDFDNLTLKYANLLVNDATGRRVFPEDLRKAIRARYEEVSSKKEK